MSVNVNVNVNVYVNVYVNAYVNAYVNPEGVDRNGNASGVVNVSVCRGDFRL